MTGVLHIVGVGPGDPELMTLRAARLLAACPVVAHFRKRGAPGQARRIAGSHLRAAAEELAFDYPFTTEREPADPVYAGEMAGFYDRCAGVIAGHLAAGRDVALLCEGDPFLYGSAMYLHERLAGTHPVEVTPGITGMSGAWSRAGVPMVRGEEVLAVLPATMTQEDLTARLRLAQAAVIMKLGRNLPKVRAALAAAGRLDRAVYVARATMAGEEIRPLRDMAEGPAPYFALILVPSR